MQRNPSPRSPRRTLVVIPLVVTVVVAACGGGGGGLDVVRADVPRAAADPAAAAAAGQSIAAFGTDLYLALREAEENLVISPQLGGRGAGDDACRRRRDDRSGDGCRPPR